MPETPDGPATSESPGSQGSPELAELPEDVDPRVAEMVVAVRDRFGLRGLRDAQAMIGQEILLAEAALAELNADQPG